VCLRSDLPASAPSSQTARKSPDNASASSALSPPAPTQFASSSDVPPPPAPACSPIALRLVPSGASFYVFSAGTHDAAGGRRSCVPGGRWGNRHAGLVGCLRRGQQTTYSWGVESRFALLMALLAVACSRSPEPTSLSTPSASASSEAVTTLGTRAE